MCGRCLRALDTCVWVVAVGLDVDSCSRRHTCHELCQWCREIKIISIMGHILKMILVGYTEKNYE